MFRLISVCAVMLVGRAASAQTRDPAPFTPWGASAQVTAPAWGAASEAPTEPLRAPFQTPGLLPPRCLSGDPMGRVGVELLAGFGVGAVILGSMVAVVLVSGPRVREEALVPVLVGGALGVTALTPLAVYLAGNAMGGDGSFLAALGGSLLMGFVGSTIGYELSTSPSCSARRASVAVSPHPRRGSRRAPAIRWGVTPTVALPSATQGALVFGFSLPM